VAVDATPDLAAIIHLQSETFEHSGGVLRRLDRDGGRHWDRCGQVRLAVDRRPDTFTVSDARQGLTNTVPFSSFLNKTDIVQLHACFHLSLQIGPSYHVRGLLQVPTTALPTEHSQAFAFFPCLPALMIASETVLISTFSLFHYRARAVQG
jgi:hypothetical protein